MRKLYTILLCLATMQVSAQTPLIFDDFDLNPGTMGQKFSRPSNFVSGLGKVFFTAYHDTTGYEPWVTDGTGGGTILLKNIRTGTSYSNCGGYTEYNGKVYFSAQSGHYKSELWETNGTQFGTQQVMVVSTSKATSSIQSLIVYNGKIYFVVHDNTNGYELWESDGTQAGTKIFKDINPGNGDSHPKDLYEFNGKLYFSADDGTNGRELWVTDGTTNGTVMFKDIVPGSGSSGPGIFFESNNDLYFRATTPATGYELWKTDGTANGTQMVADISGDSSDGIRYYINYGLMATYNSKLYFNGFDSTNGYELWVTDGTANGTKLVKDINPSGSSSPGQFTVYKNKLYFSASDTTNHHELWETDGTTNGTVMVGDFFPGKFGSSPYLLTVYKNHLYFRAQIDTGDMQLIRSDGTYAGSKVVRPPTATVQKDCAYFFTSELFINPTDSAMYFAAEYTATGYELWKLKDTTGSTQPGSVDNINSHSDFTLYPNPNNGTFTLELSKTNFKAASLQVYDITGRLCYHEPINNSKSTIKVNLMSGTYFVKLLVDDEVMTKKVMVE